MGEKIEFPALKIRRLSYCTKLAISLEVLWNRYFPKHFSWSERHGSSRNQGTGRYWSRLKKCISFVQFVRGRCAFLGVCWAQCLAFKVSCSKRLGSNPHSAAFYLISHRRQEMWRLLCAGADEGLLCTSGRRSRSAGTLTSPGSRGRSCMWKSWRMCRSQHTILYVLVFMKWWWGLNQLCTFKFKLTTLNNILYRWDVIGVAKEVFNHNSLSELDRIAFEISDVRVLDGP